MNICGTVYSSRTLLFLLFCRPYRLLVDRSTRNDDWSVVTTAGRAAAPHPPPRALVSTMGHHLRSSFLLTETCPRIKYASEGPRRWMPSASLAATKGVGRRSAFLRNSSHKWKLSPRRRPGPATRCHRASKSNRWLVASIFSRSQDHTTPAAKSPSLWPVRALTSNRPCVSDQQEGRLSLLSCRFP